MSRLIEQTNCTASLRSGNQIIWAPTPKHGHVRLGDRTIAFAERPFGRTALVFKRIVEALVFGVGPLGLALARWENLQSPCS
jgi:hypothetical protein